MKRPFCDYHLERFWKRYTSESTRPLPLDQALADYFREHRSLGAHDRRQIGSKIYHFVRWKPLVDAAWPDAPFFVQLDKLCAVRPLGNSPLALQQVNSLPPYALRGMTPFLWEALLQAYGAESAEKVADALQSEAPVTIRANLLKTTQQALYEQLSPRFPSLKKLSSPAALTFGKREPLFSLPEFKEGLFEVQDEGSQQVAELMAVAPGDQVVDYCSGSGGKTLAFAPKMGGKGQIYLHDIRLSALAQAKKRLRRAGVQNGQCLPSDHPKWRQLEEKVDWILVDAPCSGSGTLRRNPEMKFFIDSSLVARLVQEQRSIFDQAIRLLKPGGKLVYATCSLLPAENGEQLSWFLDRYPIALERPPLAILPEIGGPDAFFAAVVVKTASMLGYSRI